MVPTSSLKHLKVISIKVCTNEPFLSFPFVNNDFFSAIFVFSKIRKYDRHGAFYTNGRHTYATIKPSNLTYFNTEENKYDKSLLDCKNTQDTLPS